MKHKRIKQIGISFILILLCIGAILFSENQSKKQRDMSQTLLPQNMNIVQSTTISGNIYPQKEIEVKSSVSGTLDTYYVDLGSKVKVGDKIAKIKMLPEPSQLESARKSLKVAHIVYNNNKINYKRDSILFRKGVIARSEFEEVSKVYFVSKEEYESAKNQLFLLEEGNIPSSNISNIVVATVAGTIIDLPLDEGTSVTERNSFREGSTIALIAQQDSFVFRGKIIEDDVLSLKKNMQINVIPIFKRDYVLNAYVNKITPKGELEGGIMKYKFEAILTFNNADTIPIFSGFNAVAEFIINEKKNVIAIPEECLFFENDSTYIKVLEDGKFVRRNVTIGISDGINIEIKRGITMKDRILSKKILID